MQLVPLGSQHTVEFTASLQFSPHNPLWNAPHVSDVVTCRRVVNGTIAGELIGLLSMFAATLSIALTCNAAVPTERVADLSESESKIDTG
jgi:hypothetical protein